MRLVFKIYCYTMFVLNILSSILIHDDPRGLGIIMSKMMIILMFNVNILLLLLLWLFSWCDDCVYCV